MFKFFAIVSCMVLSMSVVASAQLEWDKKKPLKPVENPSPVGASRVDIISEAKALLAKNEIPVLSETADEEGGKHTIVTEQVVFARGIVAKTQLGHFAQRAASRPTKRGFTVHMSGALISRFAPAARTTPPAKPARCTDLERR